MGLQKASLILALACAFTNVQAQFTKGDFTINTVGLSDDYAQRFKQEETVEVLVSMFNRLGITPEISPVKISVVYDRTGTVVAEFNYDHERIFSRGTDYLTHNDNWKGWGDGISVYLQDQVFLALGQFKKSAASDGSAMDRELLNFESEVRLINSDGNWVRFFGYDRMDYNGWDKFRFYTNAQINYDGLIYEVETSNSKVLNEMKYFFVGKSIGLDGSKTGAYYFSRFFKFSEEDKKILEEKKRKEEERKREEQKRKEEHARIEAEKRRLQKELEWKEKVLFSEEYFFSSQLSNKSEIYLTVKSDILEDLHHFVEYFQKEYSSGYYQKERQYEHNLKYAEANGNEPEDYSLLDLLLCFGKDRSLSKVTVRDVLTNSGYDDIHVGTEFFEKIREHVSINEVAKIEIDEISYPVNSMFMLFLTPHVSTTETTYRLAKNKKGGIKLQGLSNEIEMQLLPVLSENQQIALLGKGSYLITVATRTTRLRVTYFFPNKEEKVHNKVFIKKELLSVEPK